MEGRLHLIYIQTRRTSVLRLSYELYKRRLKDRLGSQLAV